MSKNYRIRQSELVPEECLSTPITVIGAGAVGSWTTLALAKMGFESIEVWDFDKVDDVNMACQFFGVRDIGKPKVDALQSRVYDMTNVMLSTENKRYEGGQWFPGIVIAALDSMAVRKSLWEAHRETALTTRAFIDPRMGAEVAQLYSMRPMVTQDVEAYERSLYSDDQAVHERCTAKATTYCALMLSGLIAQTVKQVAAGQKYTRTATWSIRDGQLHAWLSK